MDSLSGKYMTDRGWKDYTGADEGDFWLWMTSPEVPEPSGDQTLRCPVNSMLNPHMGGQTLQGIRVEPLEGLTLQGQRFNPYTQVLQQGHRRTRQRPVSDTFCVPMTVPSHFPCR